MVFHAAAYRRCFFEPKACLVLEQLSHGPQTEEQLRECLRDSGVTDDELDLRGFLEQLAREQLLIRGVLNRLVDMGVGRRLNLTGKIEPIVDPATGVSVPGSPIAANIYLTLNCNLSCRHCGINMSETRPTYLTAQEWGRVFDDFERHCLQTITLNGGEPLAHPEAKDILRDLSRRPFFVRVYSNATLLDEETADICSRSRNFIFSVSLDGHSAEIHDDFRGVPGAFASTLRALDLLRTAHAPVPFYIASIIHRGSLPYLREMADLAEKQGAGSLAYLAMNFVGRARETDYYVSLEKHRGAMDEVRELAETKKGRMMITLQGRGPTLQTNATEVLPFQGRQNVCACGVLDITLGPDGQVYPCEACFTLSGEDKAKYAMGDILADGLGTIWASPRWALYRGGIAREDLTACSGCDRYDTCGQRRCRFYSLASGQDFFGPASECLDYLKGIRAVG